MNRRLPPEAFEHYVSLGQGRSYQAVADHFEVSKPTVTSQAKREDWQGRLGKIEAQAREKADVKLGDVLAEMRERHLKTIKAMNMRALEALRSHPLTSGMDAIRAAEAAIKLERLIHGEPTDRNAVSVEEITKRELSRMLVIEEVEDEDPESEEAKSREPPSDAP